MIPVDVLQGGVFIDSIIRYRDKVFLSIDDVEKCVW